jgi:hypothetical protein
VLQVRPYVLAILLVATLGFGPGTAQAKGHSTLHCKHGYVKKLVTVEEDKHGHVIRVKATRCVKHHTPQPTTPAPVAAAPVAVVPAPEGVNKAAYIVAADALCTTINAEFQPAFEATRSRNLAYAFEHPVTVATTIDNALKNSQVAFQQLLDMPSPETGSVELHAYFVYEADRRLATAKVAVALLHEEPSAMGGNLWEEENDKIEAHAAVVGYGFTVCGQ